MNEEALAHWGLLTQKQTHAFNVYFILFFVNSNYIPYIIYIRGAQVFQKSRNYLKILDSGMAAWIKFCTDNPQTFRRYLTKFCRPVDLTPGIVLSGSIYFQSLRSGHHHFPPHNLSLHYCYYLLQLSCHSVAVVLTLVETKQIRINIHKRNNKKQITNSTQHSKYEYTFIMFCWTCIPI